MRDRLKTDRAIVVEGRDDAAVVSEACDALIIITHGYGISAETWRILEKADREKGLIILTDPDHAGEQIRRRLTEKFPDSLQCYLTRADAAAGDDIGIENADPDAVRLAVAGTLRAAERRGLVKIGSPGKAYDSVAGKGGSDDRASEDLQEADSRVIGSVTEFCEASISREASIFREASMADLTRLGLAGADGASQLRERVAAELGIGHCNARAMLTKLRGFNIGIDELEETTYRIRQEEDGRRDQSDQEPGTEFPGR